MIAWPALFANLSPAGCVIAACGLALGVWLVARDVIAARRERSQAQEPRHHP